MSITTTAISHSDPKNAGFQLDVELENSTTVAVRAGSFRLEGVDYSFLEDQLWEMTPNNDYAVYVTGFLAVEKSSGEPLILVDEFIKDGEDASFRFEGSPYKPLLRAFSLRLPAKTSDLTAVDISVSQVLPFPDPKKN